MGLKQDYEAALARIDELERELAACREGQPVEDGSDDALIAELEAQIADLEAQIVALEADLAECLASADTSTTDPEPEPTDIFLPSGGPATVTRVEDGAVVARLESEADVWNTEPGSYEIEQDGETLIDLNVTG